ncbi:MAG: LCP family protein [Xylanivirga thermophila]|jgi:polyisoprenyl-teichoic acid--peptidoglycan teichoic acid transferase|uniref:LCP family protein n=1 Tax=Xylanivirga thermophila TaxID=2496273 RepID=UPI00101E1B1A|nr:LCP family protein [Xylanivirga thermophila]
MKKFLTTILIILIIALVGAGAYTAIQLNRIKETPLDEIDGDNKITEKDLGISDSAPDEKDTGVINILLFGVDRRTENEKPRSDSIMIATIDKKYKCVKLTSIMRDTFLPIPGKEDNRINAAYAFGGPSLAIRTVNSNFNMDIQRYVTVNFQGMEKIIDTLGGVEIELTKGEPKVLNQYLDELNKLDKEGKKSPYIKNTGLQKLDGKQAVAYCRIRYVGNGDYKRTERQRTVLNELFKKAKTVSPMKIPELVTTIIPYIETNMSKTEMLTLGASVMGFKDKELKQFRLPVEGAYTGKKIRGMEVLVPDIEANTNLLHSFIYGDPSQMHLDGKGGMDKETVETFKQHPIEASEE